MNVENQREHNKMVRLGKDNDAVYEEILPSGKKFLTSTFNNNEMEHEGHIDVGNGCWRRNQLVTTFRCW